MKKLVAFLFMFSVGMGTVLARSGTCGENLTWVLDEKGTLTISGTGAMTDYSHGGSPWYEDSSVRHLVVESGVTHIGAYAFEGCERLSLVYLSETITSIDYSAFYERSDEGPDYFICIATVPPEFSEVERGLGTCYVPSGSVSAYQAAKVWRDMDIIPLPPCNAATGFASGTCGAEGNNLSWKLSCDRILTISGSGNMGDNSFPWMEYKGLIWEVIIEEGVTSIGDRAFYDLNITSISIANSVTSIGDRAFNDCNSLISIEIPNSVTSIGEEAFGECGGLTSVTIPNSVTSIGAYAFSACENLPVENGIRYADTYLMWAVDESLSAYTIKEGTRWIGEEAFDGCNRVTAMEIPNSVISIGSNAFSDCKSLTSVTIPNSITRIQSGTFAGCSSLARIDIPNNVRKIEEGAFNYCVMDTLIIPEGVDTIEGAFDGSKIKYLRLPGSLRVIGDGSYASLIGELDITACSADVLAILTDSLIRYSASPDNPRYKVIDGVLFSKSGKTILNYPSEKKDATYTLPHCVDSIGSSDNDQIFGKASHLSSLVFSENLSYVYMWGERSTPLTLTFGHNPIAYVKINFVSERDLIIPNIYSYSLVPSDLSRCDFYDINKKKIKCYVQQRALATYQNTDVWKDFTLIAVDNEYKITWKGATGEILQESYVKEGQVPNYSGATPLKPATADSTYTFVGWTQEIVNVTGDATYTAVFSAAEKLYSVQGLSNDKNLGQVSVAKQELPYAGFTALEESSIKLVYKGTIVGCIPTLEYSYDGLSWNQFAMSTVYPIATGQTFYLRGNNPNGVCRRYDGYSQFTMTGTLEGSGDMMSMVDSTCSTTAVPNYCFYRLFYNCTALTKAPKLTGTTLASSLCYNGMFYGCTNLQHVEVAFDSWENAKGLLNSVASTGTFVKPAALPATIGSDYIPSGWTVVDKETLSASPSTNSGEYKNGTTVVLTATPTEHSHFVQWNDNVTTNPRAIVVTKDTVLTAIFAANTYTITTSATNGIVTGGGSFNYGTSTQITATPSDCYAFTQWSDGNTDNPRTITVTGDATYTAEFTKINYTIRGQNASSTGGSVQVVNP